MENPQLRILVADDNAAAAEIIATLLTIQGHMATPVFDGETAIKTAKAIQPHLILLDINLGDMSGYEVCAELRNEPALQNTMVVAVTGLKQSECEMAGAHFDEYLSKPTGMEVVDALLQRCIHRLNNRSAVAE